MALTEDIIFADPVLKRVFYDDRALAPMPGHDAIVSIALHEIANLKVLFFKAKAVDTAERLAWLIRRQYFIARRHSEGRHLEELERRDHCEHVQEFAHNERDPVFNVDHRARSAYRHRYSYRPATPGRYRPGRTRSL